MSRYSQLLRIVLFLFLAVSVSFSQNDIEIISDLKLSEAPKGKITKCWLHFINNGMSQPVYVPIIIARGNEDGPILGLTAAIHGDELNGIPIIQEVYKKIDPTKLKGTLVGVPGLNVISINLDRRRYIDEEDLNRNLPGKENGNRSQQYAFRIFDKIVQHFDLLVDMHTASFGRINSMYVRADLSNDTMLHMSNLQGADIILDNKGIPSAGQSAGANRTLRAEAVLHGIPAITIEYGNPQVYQSEMTTRGVDGILNLMGWLQMIDQPFEEKPAVICKKSYWIYTDDGGLLDVPVELTQELKKGDLIGILKNPFGDVIQRYYAPEDGLVIGKSTNPVNMNGGRIIHLGIKK